jgi:hypothetical protein
MSFFPYGRKPALDKLHLLMHVKIGGGDGLLVSALCIDVVQFLEFSKPVPAINGHNGWSNVHCV